MTTDITDPERDRSFAALPLTARCAAILRSRHHACLGVSPFNSCFTEDYIGRLARWAQGTFDGFHIFVPDTAAAFTLEALGYPPERAAHKARRQANLVRNKIVRALDGTGLDPSTVVLDGAALAISSAYTTLLDWIHQRFDTDSDLAQTCLDATGWVLDKRLPPDTTATVDQLRSAARYLLAELPLLLDTPSIVETTSSLFCYQQTIPFLDQLYQQQLSCRPSSGQGFAVVTPTAQPHQPITTTTSRRP